MPSERVVHVVVDRIEGSFAVLEVAGGTVDWPVAALPAGITEGSRMTFAICGVADDAQREAEAEAEARLERLRAKGPSSDDIEL